MFYLVDHGNRKYFSCPGCTKFQISLRAENRLADVPGQMLKNYSEMARLTPRDHLLVIVVPSPSVAGDMIGEYLLKSELRLYGNKI